jgi:uncharacterized ferritin-like protein (DUF455 family)
MMSSLDPALALQKPVMTVAALHAAWSVADPAEKVRQTRLLRQAWLAGVCVLETPLPDAPPVQAPGRPARPERVPPSQLVPRRAGQPEGRVALIHALAHIEFNAINLALDAALRFADLGEDFVGDWLRVADEEALHFSLLRSHLQSLGQDYGDFPAHDGLWEMVVKTAHDPLVRMALVPRVLEARGLDVTPQIRARLEQAGDAASIAILDVIAQDEIGHVAIGNHWYAVLCARRGLAPLPTFQRLLREYDAPALRPPFNLPARAAAAFTAEELDWLASLPVPGRSP